MVEDKLSPVHSLHQGSFLSPSFSPQLTSKRPLQALGILKPLVALNEQGVIKKKTIF